VIIVMTTAPDRSGIRVSFAYNPELVELIKSLPRYDRTWLPDVKCWRISMGVKDSCAGLFTHAGHTVMLDGAAWTPPKQQDHHQQGQWNRGQSSRSTGNIFTTFIQALPSRYRAPVWKALWKVLHPDVGGDTQLAQQLNAARPKEAA
jgi:hypothetical protein